MRNRYGLRFLVLLTTTSAFGAGLSWMTHMHHRALRYLEPGRMAEFDSGYEQLTDLTVIPVGVLGVLCSLLLLWLRPRGAPLWLIGTVLALQLSVFITRIQLWGSWAEEVRATGSVWLSNGALHPAYERYMDTNWIRIATISAYALLALVLTLRAVHANTLRAGPADTTTPGRIAR